MGFSVAVGCQTPAAPAADGSFQLAMIPDTQNYVDYTHQRDAGFALDASELFIEQMAWIAANSEPRGGDIVFVAAVGDVWQHQSEAVDAEHAARGAGAAESSPMGDHFAPTPKTRTVEIPKAIEGYRRIAATGLPFGVAPGNHDYDAMWGLETFPPNLDKDPSEFEMADLGMLHVGGLDNFRSAFGDDSEFFRGQSWYVASFRGGANSAQVFEAGGYRFLHFALEMSADDEVLAWVESVLARYPDTPTILSTHDYLDSRGRRAGNPIIDLAAGDPGYHNSAEEIWADLIARNDDIFLVLCGHHHGQAFRTDLNESGHEVYQMLADFQDRGQVGIDAGQPLDPFIRGPVGIGDGWFRLLEFDLAASTPILRVRTYSTHYKQLSGALPTYAAWYREHEQPDMTDVEFLEADAFEVELVDFRKRFGEPNAQ
jgi:hypothetical protein